MAATANSSAIPNNNDRTRKANVATANNNAGGVAEPKNSVVRLTHNGLKHNCDVSVKWTMEEQALLEKLLTEYASESMVTRYAKIAGMLQDKRARDVALRCRWMIKKEIHRRRKEDNTLPKKNKEKKVKGTEQMPKRSSHAKIRANGSSSAQPATSMDTDNEISKKAIGGEIGRLLEQNKKAMDQVSANLKASKVHENINLLSKTRDNLLTILNNLDDSEVLKHMPRLPVEINEELCKSILPQSSSQKKPKKP